MKKLNQWSVKELVEGYGDVVPEIGNESDHIDALHAVLAYEANHYNEKYADELETVSEDEELLELDDDVVGYIDSIPQH